jgi:hypothetical protein
LGKTQAKSKRSDAQNRTEKFRGTYPKNQRPEPLGEQAKQIQRGWLNYFRGTSIQGKLRDIDGWLRNRLRYCIWTDWKKPERKRKNLMRLGMTETMLMLGAEQEKEAGALPKVRF